MDHSHSHKCWHMWVGIPNMTCQRRYRNQDQLGDETIRGDEQGSQKVKAKMLGNQRASGNRGKVYNQELISKKSGRKELTTDKMRALARSRYLPIPPPPLQEA